MCLQSDIRLSLIALPLYVVDMTMHFSQNNFHLDQFGFNRAFRTKIEKYEKHARANCTQMGTKTLRRKFGKKRPIYSFAQN